MLSLGGAARARQRPGTSNACLLWAAACLVALGDLPSCPRMQLLGRGEPAAHDQSLRLPPCLLWAGCQNWALGPRCPVLLLVTCVYVNL